MEYKQPCLGIEFRSPIPVKLSMPPNSKADVGGIAVDVEPDKVATTLKS